MRYYVFLTAIFLGAFDPFYSVEAQTSSSVSSSTSADQGELQEVTVTAMRRSQNLKDVPVTVIALSGEQLAQGGVDDTRDLTRVVPGLVFSSQGAWAEPNIRGITTTLSGAGSESPVSIYVDGVYQTSQVASLFDLPDVQQIQVLKGPQGTLFGRNATAGAILINTREPSFTPTADVTAEYGYFTGNGGSQSANDYKLKGFVSGPLADNKLAGSLSFLVEDAAGFLHNDVSNSRDGAIRSYILRGKLLFTPTSDTNIELENYYSHRKDYDNTTPFPINGVTAAKAFPGNVIATEPWHTTHTYPTFIETEAWGSTLRFTEDFNVGKLTSITAFNSVRTAINVEVDGAYVAPGAGRKDCFNFFSCIYVEDQEPSKTISQELDFASIKYGPFSYVAGFFGYYASESLQQIVDFVVLDTKARVRSNAYAPFAEGTLDVTDRLSVVLGGRYSFEQKIGATTPNVATTPLAQVADPHWHAFTPRASLRFKVDDYSNLYATYSKGFNSGVLDAVSLAPSAPEHLNSYEIGFKRSTTRYAIDLSAFYYDFQDLQIQSFNGTTSATTNASKATVYGLDFEASAYVTDALKIRLAGSYLPTAKYKDFTTATYYSYPVTATGGLTQYAPENVSGDRLIRSPKFTGTFSLNYKKQIAWGTLTTDASIYHSDSYAWELSYRVKTASYNTVNGQISFQPTDSHLRYSVWGKNLTNKSFIDGVVESAAADMGVWNAPREIGVSANFSF